MKQVLVLTGKAKTVWKILELATKVRGNETLADIKRKEK